MTRPERFEINYLVACPSKNSICTCRSCGTNINIYREVLSADGNQHEGNFLVKCARCGSVTKIRYAESVE